MIGDDAVLVTSNSALQLTDKAILIAGSDNQCDEDLVASLSGVASESLPSVQEKARNTWLEITRHISHPRLWRCHACNALNAYRVNGETH